MSKNKRPMNPLHPVLGWWHKHKTLFKAAIIAGVAGVFGSIIYPMAKDYLSTRIPPTVNVYAGQYLNWEDAIFAEDTGLSEEDYRVVTNACLEGYTSRGTFLTTLGNSARATEFDRLQGTVYMTVSSEKPILINKVTLEVRGNRKSGGKLWTAAKSAAKRLGFEYELDVMEAWARNVRLNYRLNIC
ncbi:MAG: hypothetical protein ACREVY_12730 [Gammaproteobacteria bacterium]